MMATAQAPWIQGAIPDELRERPHWLAFYLTQEGDKLKKTPISGASSTDPTTWRTFGQVAQLAKPGRVVLGFALPADRSITLIDLDGCLDAGGNLLPWAAPIVARFAGGTFMEVTPSGSGLHIWLLGSKKGSACKVAMNPGLVEIYDHARLVTVTGRPFRDAPPVLLEMQSELNAFYDECFPDLQGDGPTLYREAVPLDLPDSELIDLASAHPVTGADFAALWRGDISTYDGDESRCEYHLCRHLAYWTGWDAQRIDRLVHSSGLIREKWDRKDGTYGTYGARTIAKAIARQPRCYRPLGDPSTGSQVDFRPEAPETEECSGPTLTSSACSACATKDREIARLRRELQKAQARIKDLEHDGAWERKLRANKQISATQRLVCKTLSEEYAKAAAKGRLNEHGEAKIYYPKLAKQCGVSPQTFGDAAKKLADWGAYKHRNERHINASNGQRVSRVYVAPIEGAKVLVIAPDKIAPEKPRNHGGKRFCPTCGSTSLKETRRLVCADCGTVISQHEHWVNREDDASATEGQVDFRPDVATEQEISVLGAPAGDIAANAIVTPQCEEEEDGKNPHRSDGHESNCRLAREEVLALAEAEGWPRLEIAPATHIGGNRETWERFTTNNPSERIELALAALVRPGGRLRVAVPTGNEDGSA
jgi:hypothetical protein